MYRPASAGPAVITGPPAVISTPHELFESPPGIPPQVMVTLPVPVFVAPAEFPSVLPPEPFALTMYWLLPGLGELMLSPAEQNPATMDVEATPVTVAEILAPVWLARATGVPSVPAPMNDSDPPMSASIALVLVPPAFVATMETLAPVGGLASWKIHSPAWLALLTGELADCVMETPPAVTVTYPEAGGLFVASRLTQTSSRFALAATLCVHVSDAAPVVVLELEATLSKVTATGHPFRTSTQSGSPPELFPQAEELYVDPAVTVVAAPVSGSTRCAVYPAAITDWSMVMENAFAQ